MGFQTLSASGAKLRDLEYVTAITDLRPVSALKVGDQIVNNSTTLVNDVDLFVPVVASAAYHYELHLTYISNGTANWKINWTFPSGAVLVRSNYLAGATAATQHGPLVGALVGGLTGNGADTAFDMWGYLTTSSTAGNFQLQWAQTTAAVFATTVRDGSFLVLRRLS